MPLAIRTRVKICGITRPADALAVAAAGADAIGLVFYPPSPRGITAQQACSILAVLPPFVTATGLFVNADAAAVERVLETAALDLLQFHGDETPEFCASFGLPWVKALRVRPDADAAQLRSEMQRFAGARGILLDAWHEHLYGGSGKTFDWSLLAQAQPSRNAIAGHSSDADNVATSDTDNDAACDRAGSAENEPVPLILAGGLSPRNVGEAIRLVRPWAVDVSSGVEEAPGLKSRALINAFMQEVQRA